MFHNEELQLNKQTTWLFADAWWLHDDLMKVHYERGILLIAVVSRAAGIISVRATCDNFK